MEMTEKEIMKMLSNILHNASQGDYLTKDNILDSIKNILTQYNYSLDNKKVSIDDFRNHIIK